MIRGTRNLLWIFFPGTSSAAVLIERERSEHSHSGTYVYEVHMYIVLLHNMCACTCARAYGAAPPRTTAILRRERERELCEPIHGRAWYENGTRLV